MRADAILLPLCAQVLLTFAVWLWMYYTRLTTIFRSRVPIQDLAIDAKFDAVTATVKNPSDNFENQFEMPVLFYIATLLIFTTALTDSVYVWLSWIFVAFRVAHALVHCTYNWIRRRFLAYALSSLSLGAIWLRLAWQIWSQSEPGAAL